MGTILSDLGNVFPLSPFGGSGNDVAIYNEGVLVSDKVSKINFVGADINAVLDSIDPNQVNIQVPASTLASHFNTNDGIASAIVNDIVTINRNIANPNGAYDIGDWILPAKKPTTNTGIITYSTPNFFSILDNTSTIFTATILGGDNITIIAQHSIILTGNVDITNNNIRIVVTGFTNDHTKYKANIQVSFNLISLLPYGGRFSIKLEHNNGAEGIFTKTQNNIFFDSNNNPPVMSNPTYSINIPKFKYLSGVKYLTKNTTIGVNIANIDYLNDRSYPNIQVNILGNDLGLPQLDLSGSQLTDWNNNYNNTGASYNKTDWAITTDNIFKKGNTVVQARWIDWISNTLQNSLPQSLLIDTYISNRTRIKEDFNDETYRLKNNLSIWDSIQHINTYIDNTDGLQLENSKLIYPQDNYKLYNPDSSSQPDYSSLVGDRKFISYFYYQNISKSNGIFSFTNHNLTETDIINEDFILEISLNGVDWFNVCKPYFGGALQNGEGCRIDSSTYNLSNNRLRFTLSTYFTNNTTGSVYGNYWGIFFRIIYKDTIRGRSLYIGSIEITDWV